MTIQDTSIVLILAPVVAPLFLFVANMPLVLETKHFKAANVSVPAYIIALMTGVAGTVFVLDFFLGSFVAWAGVLSTIYIVSLVMAITGFVASFAFDGFKNALVIDQD